MSNYVRWKDDYSVGITEIDNQHKILIQILNELYTAFTQNTTKTQLKDILVQLVDYAQYHFTAEETLFVGSGYTNADKHVAKHNDFKKTVSDFMDDFEKSNARITYKLMTFLNNWLISHIMEEDQEYAPYIKNKSDIPDTRP